ncbi:hypothetical protein ACX8XN_15085 [Calditrichota bacterium GD2]
MIGRWEFIIGLVIIVNLFNFIWLTHIRYKRTIGRRRHRWKRWLSIAFFVLSPAVFIFNLLSLPLMHYFNLLLGGMGVWFGLSQLRFVNRHSGVPPIVEPLSIFYLIICTLLSMLGAMKIV